MASEDRNVVYADDWFVDREGRTWSVKSIDLAKHQVTLRLVHPPERIVTLDELKANYELAGFGRRIEQTRTERVEEKKEADDDR